MWESSSEEEDDVEDNEEMGQVKTGGGIVDVEDVGNMLRTVRVPRGGKELKIRKKTERREMVTPLLRKNLTKQGTYNWNDM